MNQWIQALKVAMRRPTFLTVFLVLLAGAIGINGATGALKLKFRKEAMPLRSKDGLTALPQQIGTWVCVPEPQTVNPDQIHDLQTDQFTFRTYVNTAPGEQGGVATKDEVVKLGDIADHKQRAARLLDMRNKNTNGVLTVAVTYYTGKVDTVPHVPERCYVADGFQPQVAGVRNWTLGEYAPGQPRAVPVRFIDFEDQTSREAENRCVGYFFHANGKYEQDPDVVRVRLQNLFERYAYFAKIEVMTLLPSTRPGVTPDEKRKGKDRESAATAMQDFLTAGLPEIEKLLPDWDHRAQ